MRYTAHLTIASLVGHEVEGLRNIEYVRTPLVTARGEDYNSRNDQEAQSRYHS
jgi:hypothetical protein